MPGTVTMQGAIRHFHRAEVRRLYNLLGDDELLARFLTERDETAFEELVCRHGPMVRAVCRRVLGPTADADDAFQATFLVLIRKARSIRRTKLLANWLCAVSYRTARQALRRRWRRGAREQNVDVLPEPIHMDELPKDWLPHFDAALQRLPSRYREVVVLCDLQGLSRADAALKLQINEGTLSSRLGRARDLLRRRLGRHGFTLAIGSTLAPAVVPESLTASTMAAALHTSAASVSAIVLSEGVLTAMLASKLKAFAACATVLVAGTVVGLQFTGPRTLAEGPPAKSPPKVAPKDDSTPAKSEPPVTFTKLPKVLEPFQGEWVVTSTEQDGRANSPAGVGVDENWKFTGDILTTGGEAKEDAVESFVIDAKAKPASIDFVLTRFAEKGTGELDRVLCQGSYKFEADGRLVICFRLKGEGIIRPTRFATANNSGVTLLSLRRPPPPMPEPSPTRFVDSGTVVIPVMPPKLASSTDQIPPPQLKDGLPPIPQTFEMPRPASDMEQLQGMWRLSKRNGDGVKATSPDGRDSTIEIVKDRILLESGSHGRVRIDVEKVPKQITFDLTAGQKAEFCRFIYKIDGDTLTLAGVAQSEKLVPIDFDRAPGSGIVVEVYERVKNVPPHPPRVTPAATGPLPMSLPGTPPSYRDTSIPPPSILPKEPSPPGVKVPDPPVRNDNADPFAAKPPERDLLKEIDQLREQLKQLEKLLKERK